MILKIPTTQKRLEYAFDDEDYEKKSLRRAKTTLMDTVLCNPFDIFATFTFAKDRYNVDGKKQQMAYWLNNQRILHGAFKYIIVPEFHKDGKALHFHALFGGFKGNLVKSGKLINGRTGYNFSGYRAGWNSAVIIDDNIEKVSSYVTKYMTKGMPKFRNKQRYWCSNGLKRPLKITNPLLTEQDEQLFTSIYSNDNKEILEFRGQLSDNDIGRIAKYGLPREDDLIASEL